MLALGELVHLGVLEYPLVGGFRLVVALPRPGALPHLLLKPGLGLEEVEVEAEHLVEAGKEKKLLIGIVAEIPHVLPQRGVVLLLNVVAVVLARGAASGEGDLMFFAIPLEMVVDELRPVVRVYAQEGKGELS